MSKGNGRFSVVSKRRPMNLLNIERDTDIIQNTIDYIADKPHLNLIKKFESHDSSSFEVDELFDMWPEYDIRVDLIEHNMVRMFFYMFDDLVVLMEVEIQPSFVKDFLDAEIRGIAKDLEEHEERERRANRREEIRRQLLRGEM